MIASGSIHAVVNGIVKGCRDKMASRAVTDGSTAVIALPAILFVVPPAGAWGWLALSAVAHAVYIYALIRACRVADFSAAYPVLRGTAPVVTAAVTIGILKEPASLADIAGIALIASAMFALAAQRHLDGAALRWSLLTGVCIAGYTVVDGHGVRAAPTVASYIVWLFVLFGAMIVVMFGLLSRGAKPAC
jgi:multidrug transporter EmrE-like cation transporter